MDIKLLTQTEIEQLKNFGLSDAEIAVINRKRLQTAIDKLDVKVNVKFNDGQLIGKFDADIVKLLINAGYKIEVKIRLGKVTDSKGNITYASFTDLRVKEIDGNIRLMTAGSEKVKVTFPDGQTKSFTSFSKAIDAITDAGYIFHRKVEGQSARRILTAEKSRLTDAGYKVEFLV